MSYDAERWARSQKVGNASAKFVFIELANALNRDDKECYPSVEALEVATELNRKTIMAATKFLEERGFIKKRRTFENGKQRIYYSFPSFIPSDWAMKQSTKNGTLEDTKNGTLIEESTENGTAESTEIGTLESTKNGTVTRNKNKEIEQGIDISVEEKPKRIVLKKPDCVSEELWSEWKKFRKNKRFSITERVLNNLIRESEKAGLTLEQAMNIQLDREWRGFNADWLKNKQPQQRYGFQEKKQEERHYELW